jgi:sugar phosphate isomerase/epimerase
VITLLASSLAFHPESPDRVVPRVAEMGFAGMEFLCEPPWHPAAWSPALVRRVRGAGGELSLHVPVADVNLMSPHPGVRALAEDEIAATLELAAKLGVATVTFHLGYRPAMGTSHEPPWGAAFDAARRLRHQASAAGIALCLENDPKLPGAYLWDLARFQDVLRELGLPGTLDLGHAWISHGLDALAQLPELVPHLQVVHLHDNRGTYDEHLTLGEGDVDVDRAWAVLKGVPLAVIEVKEPGGLRASRDRLLGQATVS